MRDILFAIILILALAGCNLDTETPTPVPTPDLPQVQFLYPAEGARVVDGTDLTLDILAQDQTAGVQRIELYVDGQLLNSDAVLAQPESAFRAELNWFANGIGKHILSAVAYRADGTPSNEAALTVDVIAQD